MPRRASIPEGVFPRRCLKCLIPKAADDFPLDPRRRDGHYPYCKPCKAEVMKGYAQARREDGRLHIDLLNRSLRQAGVDMAWWEREMKRNDGRCRICRRGPTGNHGRLVVDHDHVTGKARGILCGDCNAALGLLQDRPYLLRVAAAYLENPGW